VIICCHNSATRLPTTLAHLIGQHDTPIEWEVLLVNNSSTDNTAAVARACWRDGPVPLRIVEERRLGLLRARERGLVEAKYPFLGFIDDDNWVAPDWVRVANEVISSDPELGAVGSISTPVFEIPPPAWFDNFHSTYAVLTDREFEQISQPLDYVAGAGLCLRKAAWVNLIENGYRSQIIGREGEKLRNGEDRELTMALRLSGWKLRIDPRLRLQHFMPKQRLQWKYLRTLFRNSAVSHVLLDAYFEHSLSLESGFRRWLSERWWYQFGRCLGKMACRPSALISAILSEGVGRNEIIEIETEFGRSLGLLRFNKRYSTLRREVQEAIWRKKNHADTRLTHSDPTGSSVYSTANPKGIS
jgi:glycosyltransferase involved in cell wall biosynthesis